MMISLPMRFSSPSDWLDPLRLSVFLITLCPFRCPGPPTTMRLGAFIRFPPSQCRVRRRSPSRAVVLFPSVTLLSSGSARPCGSGRSFRFLSPKLLYTASRRYSVREVFRAQVLFQGKFFVDGRPFCSFFSVSGYFLPFVWVISPLFSYKGSSAFSSFFCNPVPRPTLRISLGPPPSYFNDSSLPGRPSFTPFLSGVFFLPVHTGVSFFSP